jgi:uncharacterized protein (DUF362 family)
MMTSNCRYSRRSFLASAAAASALPVFADKQAPASKVAIARCEDYGAPLGPALKTMFDQLGGLGHLVKGKTVAIKVNLTGSPLQRLGTTPAEFAQYTHPAVIGQVTRLCGEAGAVRVRILEGAFSTGEPLEEFMLEAGWDPAPLWTAASKVEFENTNLRGRWPAYARYKVQGTPYIFPEYYLNQAYEKSDVIISIAKLKEHATAGITLAIKNMFGALPLTIYGDQASKTDVDEDAARGGRGTIMHDGRRQPAAISPKEIDPTTPRAGFYRIPRIISELAAAVPIHLSIVDGIFTMAGGEGPWNRGGVRPIRPRVLLAGLNPVCTDAVGTAVMGFDPMAAKGTAPFERCDSTLELTERLGVGTRDLKRIEVVGQTIESVKFDIRKRA